MMLKCVYGVKMRQDPVTAGCGHTFCRGCIREFMDGAAAEGAATCPTCSRPLTVALDQVCAPAGVSQIFLRPNEQRLFPWLSADAVAAVTACTPWQSMPAVPVHIVGPSLTTE